MRTGMRGLVNKLTQIGIPSGRVALQLQFNSSPGLGARAGLQPALGVARDRQARGARGEAGGEGVQDRRRSGRGAGRPSTRTRRPTPTRARPCVWLWARDQNLCNGPGAAGPAPRSVAHGRAAEPACGCSVRVARRPDPVGRRRSARQGDRRSRHCRQSRARAARAPAGGRARRARRARSRARLRRRSLSRQPRGAPGALQRSRCRGAPRVASSSTSCGATPSARVSHPGDPSPPRSPNSTKPTAACGHAWWRRRDRSRGSAAGPAGSRSRRSHRPGSSPWTAEASSGRSTGGSRCAARRHRLSRHDPDHRGPGGDRASLNRFARVYAYEAWLAKAEEGRWRRPSAPATSCRRRPLTLDDLLPFVAPGFN